MVAIRVNASVKIDNTGIRLQLPCIMSNGGVLKSHLEYLIAHRNRSPSWTDRSNFSIRLLLEFWEANERSFINPVRMFNAFSNSLYSGTIGENGIDESGLRWKPRKDADAKQIVALITHYCDWLIENKNTIHLNPKKTPDSMGRRMNLAAHYHKKRNAFFSHLWSKHPENLQRVISLPHSLVVEEKETVKAFPESKMQLLLNQGFIRRGMSGSDNKQEKLNIRDILITMLMYYGGLRISECFHIWLEDIVMVDGKCVVKVYHPSQGIAPNGSQNRTSYLKNKFNLIPRNQYPKKHKLHAGWKSPLLTSNTGKFFTVDWFPEKAGYTFKNLWIIYLKHQYAKPSLGLEHPFAFTTYDGSPLSIKSYNSSRKRAVERIGLKFSKEEGTTAHADRHAYGLALANAKVPVEVIKAALNHRSLESQLTYTQPTQHDINKSLSEANKTLERPLADIN